MGRRVFVAGGGESEVIRSTRRERGAGERSWHIIRRVRHVGSQHRIGGVSPYIFSIRRAVYIDGFSAAPVFCNSNAIVRRGIRDTYHAGRFYRTAVRSSPRLAWSGYVRHRRETRTPIRSALVGTGRGRAHGTGRDCGTSASATRTCAFPKFSPPPSNFRRFVKSRFFLPSVCMCIHAIRRSSSGRGA